MKSIFRFLLLIITQLSYASVELEVDPLAYGLSGHSIHFLYDTDSGIRFDIGTFGLVLDEDLETNESFKSSLKGVGLKVDFYGKELRGLFAGVQYDKMNITITEIDSEESKEVSDDFIGMRVGYNILFGNFYISPWVSISQRLKKREDIVLNNRNYRFEGTTVFPTIHLGWKF